MSSQPEALRKARKDAAFTLDEAAQRLHVSRAALSNYERRIRRVPIDIQAKAPDVYRNPLLRLQACADCKIGFFQVPVLDLVDTHPVAGRDKLIEELGETVAVLGSLNLVNKRGPADFTASERDQVLTAMDEIWDVFNAAALNLVTFSRLSGLDLASVADRYKRKCFEKHYWSAAKEKAPAKRR